MEKLTEGRHISKEIDSIRAGDFIASRTVLSAEDFNGVRHYHLNAHFSFVLKGGCAEVKHNHYERTPGSITWYQSGEPHQMTRVTARSYHINFELPERFFSLYGINEATIGEALENHPLAGILMVKTYLELTHPDEHSVDSLRMLLLGLVQGEARLRRPGTPAWVKTARELLNDNWDKKVTLMELSAACGIHPVTVSKYFPAYFLCTIGEYSRMLKIRHSVSMIRRKRIRLSEVALECGFSDQSHFIRNFRLYAGMLPSQWEKA